MKDKKTNIFGDYAHFYDFLYSDKNYREETQYVNKIIRENAPQAKTILDLGCGTGKHARALCRLGYSVTGVDISPEMLKNARLGLKPSLSGKLTFIENDIRDLHLGSQFDVVVSLFHVMDFYNTNRDLSLVFSNVRRHLKIGGVFIFDCWYGPAVLNILPEARLKRKENEKIMLTRIAEPTLCPNENAVEVNYEIIIKEKKEGKFEDFHEVHKMRYFFKPEIELFLELNGLRLVGFEEWMTKKEPDINTWAVCCVCKKTK